MNSAALNTLSDEVLATVRRRPSRLFPLEDLAARHRCQKSDIIFAIDLLRRTGYRITSDRQGRYRFVSAPDLLLAAEISHGLKTAMIGRTIYAYKSVQSTNSIAGQLAEAGAPEGSIVVAESQTRGRGRLGRPWHSPAEKGIYVSLIIYPRIDPVTAPGLSVMTAVTLAETIAAYTTKEVQIKWPNDCLINRRKVAGILTELSAEIGRVHHVIIGVGINVNHQRRDFPPEIAGTATSVRAETRKKVHRVQFLQQFLLNFEKMYRLFQKAGLKPLHAKIQNYSNLIGKRVRLDMSGRIISGTAIDIDDNGNLVLETGAGRRVFNAGEVTVVRG